MKHGEQKASSKKEYISNTILIFNSFFEYGFLNRSSSYSSSSNARSSFADEWGSSHDSGSIRRVEHYWEYLTMQFSHLESVRYINFYYEEAKSNREKALGWLMLSLNNPVEFKKVLLEIFGNIPILDLYQ